MATEFTAEPLELLALEVVAPAADAVGMRVVDRGSPKAGRAALLEEVIAGE